MSPNCDDALTSLYQYLDAELDKATSAGIRGHLDECRDCAGMYGFEQRLRQVVKDRLAEDVPEEFITRLRAALKTEQAAAAE